MITSSSLGCPHLARSRPHIPLQHRAERDNDRLAVFDDMLTEIESKVLSYLHVRNDKDSLKTP